MSRAPTGRKVLFPTHIALLLFLPSLALYVFFNTWPMIFSIGIAFTNANRSNIAPNPVLIEELKNAIECTRVLRENETLKEGVVNLIGSSLNRLEEVVNALNDVTLALERGVDSGDISSYLLKAYWSSIELKGVREDFAKYFDCSAYGFKTSLEIVSSKVLDKIDSLISSTSNLATYYAGLSSEELKREINFGLSLANELRSYLYELEEDYEGYMDNVAREFEKRLDEITLKYVGLENFARLYGDPRFYNSIYKTLLFVATSVPFKVVVGFLLALFYSSPLVYGRRALRALLLVPWAIPFLLSALTWRFLFVPGGQLARLMELNINVDEWHAFLVYNMFETWLAYPFIMTITQGALRGVSKDVIEAAYVDGAGLITRMRKIVLPLVAKPVGVAAVLTTGASLQAFLVPLTINGASPWGTICVPGVGCTPGLKNEMLIIFGYHRVVNADEGFYGYAASIYVVVLAMILIYVAVWFKVMERGRK